MCALTDPVDLNEGILAEVVSEHVEITEVFLQYQPILGADTVNPLPGQVAENETLFDDCAGSLQASTGAYGYRVIPPCLYGEPSTSVLEVGEIEANQKIPFPHDLLSSTGTAPNISVLVGNTRGEWQR